MIDALFFFPVALVIMIPILISFILLIKDAMTSPSFYELQLLISSFAFVLWTFLALPIYLAPELFSIKQIVLLEHFTTILGSLGVIFLIFSIINTYSFKLIWLPRFSIIGFAIIIGAKILQINIDPSETIYGLKYVNGQIIRVVPPIISLIIFLSFLIIFLSLAIFIKYQLSLPTYIVAEKIKNYSLICLIFIGFGLILQIIGTSLINDVYLSYFILILSRLFIAVGFNIIVLQFTQNPILSFSEKGNPAKFISNGIVNWLLVGNGSLGPETLKKSDQISKYFQPNELQLFSLKLLTSINLGSEKK